MLAPTPPQAIEPLVPISAFHVARLEQLRELVGERYAGWAVDAGGFFRVDVVGTRGFTARTLHLAIGAALRSARA